MRRSRRLSSLCLKIRDRKDARKIVSVLERVDGDFSKASSSSNVGFIESKGEMSVSLEESVVGSCGGGVRGIDKLENETV